MTERSKLIITSRCSVTVSRAPRMTAVSAAADGGPVPWLDRLPSPAQPCTCSCPDPGGSLPESQRLQSSFQLSSHLLDLLPWLWNFSGSRLSCGLSCSFLGYAHRRDFKYSLFSFSEYKSHIQSLQNDKENLKTSIIPLPMWYSPFQFFPCQ